MMKKGVVDCEGSLPFPIACCKISDAFQPDLKRHKTEETIDLKER